MSKRYDFKKKKCQQLPGFEPTTFCLQVRCSTIWTLSAVVFCCSSFLYTFAFNSSKRKHVWTHDNRLGVGGRWWVLHVTDRRTDGRVFSFMHLSMFSPTPPVRGGGDLTKQEIKFPFLGTADKIKSPLTNAWKWNGWSNSPTFRWNFKCKFPPNARYSPYLGGRAWHW